MKIQHQETRRKRRERRMKRKMKRKKRRTSVERWDENKLDFSFSKCKSVPSERS